MDASPTSRREANQRRRHSPSVRSVRPNSNDALRRRPWMLPSLWTREVAPTAT
jgi:hypothetical protein